MLIHENIIFPFHGHHKTRNGPMCFIVEKDQYRYSILFSNHFDRG